MSLSKTILVLYCSLLFKTALPQLVAGPDKAALSRQAFGRDKAAAPAPGSPKEVQPAPVTDKNDWAWEAIGLRSSSHFAILKRPVKVAVIDDGFDIDNPLWVSHIAHNSREIPGNDIDEDHNGKTDDYEGWDFGDNDEDVRPDPKMLAQESHGTRVLGVFWQVLQQLTAGDLSEISILPIKAVSDVKLNNYLKEGYKGIEYAIEQKADIILCSWAGPTISAEEKAILSKARAKGILIIASAGNFYSMQPQYPGAVPSVINVAATDRAGRKLRVSNYGVFVDISAPGDSLVTFDPFTTTPSAHLSATSAATPIVAAIVTVLRSAYPQLSPEAIERVLKNTATPLEEKNLLYAGNMGAGMVNVAAIKDALKESAPAQDVFRQPKGFIDLQAVGTLSPVRVIPFGKYRNIKFLLQTSPASSAGRLASLYPPVPSDIRVRVFKGGLGKDTILRKEELKRPFFATGDSVHIFRLAGAGIRTSRQPASPGKGGFGKSGQAWWYFEVMTIDSSTLYCSNTLTVPADSEGVIEDGSGDLNYTGRNDCKWQLTAPAGKKIHIYFEEFDTEPKLDQVYLFNGNSTKDPILAIFSGHTVPPAITSWDNRVLIWFLTSEENNFKGWKMHYKVVD
jgi:hypothetical protein